MKNTLTKDALPEMLRMSEVAEFLRLTKHDAYELLPKIEGFPVIRLSERRMRVPKDKFLKWLDSQQLFNA